MERPRGFLHIFLHGGKGLPAADFSVLRKASSDPYCVVSLDGQVHRTPTIKQSLEPVWDTPFSFQVGAFLPVSLLTLLGERPQSDAKPDLLLSIDVFDEDSLSSDDLLGRVSLDITPFVASPDQWHQAALELEPPEGVQVRGTVLLAVRWETSPVLPRYLLKVTGVSCLATAGAFKLVAAACAWQPTSDGSQVCELRQPGVALALYMGSGVAFAGCAVHFVIAHFKRSGKVDNLVASHSTSNRRPGKGGEAIANAPLLQVQMRAAGLTSYDLAITPAVDVLKHAQLPVVVLGWLLPPASLGLTSLAVLLQAAQGPRLWCRPGEVLACAGLSCTFVGLICFACSEANVQGAQASHCSSTWASIHPPRDYPADPELGTQCEQASSSGQSSLPFRRADSRSYKWWWKTETPDAAKPPDMEKPSHVEKTVPETGETPDTEKPRDAEKVPVTERPPDAKTTVDTEKPANPFEEEY